MRAFILSAGLGTRLKPLTDHAPKPLIKVAGRPMIQYVLDLLEKHNFSEVLVNVHYLPAQMLDFIKEENGKRKKLRITVQDESKKILGSGGALVRAASWLFASHENAVILNADNLLTINLRELVTAHEKNYKNFSAPCTLSVMPYEFAGIRYRGLEVKNDRVVKIHEPNPAEKKSVGLFHFPGAYVLHQSSLDYLPKEERDFSILEELWRPLVKKSILGAWEYRGPYQDLGTPKELEAAEKRVLTGEFSLGD